MAFRAETWSDPATWGIMLVEFVKHIADAYQNTGKGSRNDILSRIWLAFDAEWRTPTDHQTKKQWRKPAVAEDVGATMRRGTTWWSIYLMEGN